MHNRLMQRIGFYGAAETVTGSRHLLEFGKQKVLVDCGLFQGSRELRARNWEPFEFDPRELDAMILTHAHLDHVGMVPRLVAQGFSGPIYTTPATIGLSRISLPDSARLQEEDARQSNKHGSRHQPALPLYTEEQVYAALRQMKPISYHQWTPLGGGAGFEFIPAGHILGSAMALVTFEDGERILMSGDLGRYNTPIIRDPEHVDRAEYLVIESTYGDRLHSHEPVLDKLAGILNEAWKNGSAVLVPSFAIGRTQELLYYLRKLQDEKAIPRIPVFIDSPMAVSVTQIYRDAKEEFDQDMKVSVEEGHSELEPEGVTFVRDAHDSKGLNSRGGPMMIIAGSGMANGGRILHHLLHHLSDPSTIVLFTGYQADGTLGRRLLEGEQHVRIMKAEVQVRAKIERLNALSAHADQGEILAWLDGFTAPPKRTFIVHGEPPAQEVLREKIAERGWDVVIPHRGEHFDLP
jgi:metallo-beta-lactamase family protein